MKDLAQTMKNSRPVDPTVQPNFRKLASHTDNARLLSWWTFGTNPLHHRTAKLMGHNAPLVSNPGRRQLVLRKNPLKLREGWHGILLFGYLCLLGSVTAKDGNSVDLLARNERSAESEQPSLYGFHQNHELMRRQRDHFFRSLRSEAGSPDSKRDIKSTDHFFRSMRSPDERGYVQFAAPSQTSHYFRSLRAPQPPQSNHYFRSMRSPPTYSMRSMRGLDSNSNDFLRSLRSLGSKSNSLLRSIKSIPNDANHYFRSMRSVPVSNHYFRSMRSVPLSNHYFRSMRSVPDFDQHIRSVRDPALKLDGNHYFRSLRAVDESANHYFRSLKRSSQNLQDANPDTNEPGSTFVAKREVKSVPDRNHYFRSLRSLMGFQRSAKARDHYFRSMKKRNDGQDETKAVDEVRYSNDDIEEGKYTTEPIKRYGASYISRLMGYELSPKVTDAGYKFFPPTTELDKQNLLDCLNSISRSYGLLYKAREGQD